MPVRYKHEIKCLLKVLRFSVHPNAQAKMSCGELPPAVHC